MSVIRVPASFLATNQSITCQVNKNGSSSITSYTINTSRTGSLTGSIGFPSSSASYNTARTQNGKVILTNYKSYTASDTNLNYFKVTYECAPANIIGPNGESYIIPAYTPDITFSSISNVTATPSQLASSVRNGVFYLKASGDYMVVAFEFNSINAGIITTEFSLYYNTENNRIALRPQNAPLISYYGFIEAGLMGYLLTIPPKPVYSITVTEPSYGTCAVSKTEAEEGDRITVTCTPNAGYKLYDVFVVGDTVGRITTEKTSLNVQTFTMPADNVKVSAVFVSIDPYKPGGDTQPQDRGEGTFDNTSDEIITPDELTLNYSDSGLVRLFNPDSAKLKNFGDFLWSNLIDYDTIKKAFSNPMDQIISLHTIPIGLSTTTEEEVVFGGIGSGVSMRPLTKQFYKVNMGTLHIPRFYATALDYSPFTRLQLYLPFIGEKDIDADEVMGKDLSVSYQIDALSGAAVAYVSISGQLVYMFSGNVAQYIPVSQSNFSGIINGVTGIAGAIASVAGGILTLTGNPAIGAAMSAVGGTKSERNEARAMQMRHAQTMNTLGGVEQIGQGAGNLVNALTGKPNTAHIGLAQGVAGYMSYPTPYVLIKRPHQSLATNFYSQYGYPANLSLNLAELSGFCKLASIDITSFPGTASELAELKHILQSGFYIRGNTAPTYTTTSGLTIAFEHSNSETNACGKSLTTVAALTGELRQESDLLNPVIDIQGNIESYLTANEVCIPAFNRRYFITEWTAVRKNLFRIYLHCDVLQSFWDSIKSAPCIVERYENQWTLDLNDPYFQVSQDLLMQQLKFTSSFQLSNSSFVLAIAGNGATII